jgi:hypothetical protein
MKTLYRIALATISLMWVITACSTPKPTAVSTQALASVTEATQPTVTAPTDVAYPPPTSQANSASPLPSDQQAGATEAAYPAPATTSAQDQTTNANVTPFKFDKPIVEGTTEITGVGPAGVPIVLTDISSTPQMLANAMISSSGKFTFKVTKPLVKDQRLGLGLVNLKDSPWVDKNFADPGFQGTEPTQIPNVGVFYDTAIVQGK